MSDCDPECRGVTHIHYMTTREFISIEKCQNQAQVDFSL